jgi:hypothetical protein
MLKVYFVLLLSFFFSACEKWSVDSIKLDLNKTFSVNCILNPLDSIVKVEVFRLQEISKNHSPIPDLTVDGANVKIYNENREYILTYNSDLKSYLSYPFQIPIIEDQIFELEVKIDKTVFYGKCKIPKKPIQTIDNLKILSKTKDKVDIEFGWKDPDSLNNIYFVFDKLISNRPTGSYFILNSDIISDQKLVESKGNIINEYNISGSIIRKTEHPLKLKIFIYAIDEDLKLLMNDNYIGKGDINSEVGLFERFQNPSNKYSNIENGVGIFAAYNPLIYELNIE